jgi:hypothetical protein
MPLALRREYSRMLRIGNYNLSESGTQFFIQNASVLCNIQWFGKYAT